MGFPVRVKRPRR